MKLHRFYVGGLHDKRGATELIQKFWVNDEHLINQWRNVLRFREGDELVLFDDHHRERLYRVIQADSNGFQLELVTELEPKLPARQTYLFWALLKKDNNDLVLQKGTELGITDFVPVLTERTEKTGFDEERAKRLIIEAAEQCGRTDIPVCREPISLVEMISEYAEKTNIFVCDKELGQLVSDVIINPQNQPTGVLVGPEGGWSEDEKQLLQKHGFEFINLSPLVLRAETAAITAAAWLVK